MREDRVANPLYVKSLTSNERYEVLYIVHGVAGDVYAAYRLSHYDGMPIGPRVFLSTSAVEVLS